MYRATKSFTCKDYDVKQREILADDFTTQEEIQEYLEIGYIVVYDGSLEITENGIYDVREYETADVEVEAEKPKLQSKDLTIIENTAFNVEPDIEYDGLSDVKIKVYVPPTPDWDEIGYDNIPNTILEDFNYSKNIAMNYDYTRTNCDNLYSSNSDLVYMPKVDTFIVTSMRNMFDRCANLVSVPVLYTGNVIQMDNMFNECLKLDEDSLYNIIEMCINATNVGNKMFNSIGLNNQQISICRTLPNFNDLLQAGWIVF